MFVSRVLIVYIISDIKEGFNVGLEDQDRSINQKV